MAVLNKNKHFSQTMDWMSGFFFCKSRGGFFNQNLYHDSEIIGIKELKGVAFLKIDDKPFGSYEKSRHV